MQVDVKVTYQIAIEVPEGSTAGDIAELVSDNADDVMHKAWNDASFVREVGSGTVCHGFKSCDVEWRSNGPWNQL